MDLSGCRLLSEPARPATVRGFQCPRMAVACTAAGPGELNGLAKIAPFM
jgi:hypothetical protein